ncbi:MAG: hypothetical protein ACPIOQ_17990 [Promethearchaeia archaeon]
MVDINLIIQMDCQEPSGDVDGPAGSWGAQHTTSYKVGDSAV